MDFGPLDVRHHSHLLRLIVASHSWKAGAELGLLEGRTFHTLLRDCPTLETLIGVDAFRYMPDAPGGEVYAKIDHSLNRSKCKKVALQFIGRAHLMEMTTHKASLGVPDASLDFVFIDADHSYEGVRDDIADWTPKVRAGGWVMGHDFAPEFPGVEKAVTEAFGRHVVPVGSEPLYGDAPTVYLLPGRMWAARRAWAKI